jgi:hypothetical protein
MTDTELIELAAKGARINAIKDPNGVWRNCTRLPPGFNIFDAKPWNPLEDDGDALRLAVKLEMKINISQGNVQVRFKEDMSLVFVSTGIDKNEATRLAITRAAAEIGKVPMTEQQFEAAMRTHQLVREYGDYIMERYTLDLEEGLGLFKLMDSGDFYQGFKEKMTGSQHE